MLIIPYIFHGTIYEHIDIVCSRLFTLPQSLLSPGDIYRYCDGMSAIFLKPPDSARWGRHKESAEYCVRCCQKESTYTIRSVIMTSDRAESIHADTIRSVIMTSDPAESTYTIRSVIMTSDPAESTDTIRSVIMTSDPAESIDTICSVIMTSDTAQFPNKCSIEMDGAWSRI